MAEMADDIKLIKKNDSSFPEWLNFERLRREGMEYLGELSGKIWTDHNVHDPGITILETLCYALLDLGYRTSLSPADLFSKHPGDDLVENNFFTPAQILGCSPLTILDYRKLLIDIPGVRNAWLTVADDITIEGICGRQSKEYPTHYYSMTSSEPRPSSCKTFLNGLYHIYIDPDTHEDLDPAEKEKLRGRIRKMLMAHRNLCEDFYDITILCIQEIGVCADVELEAGTDPAKVYLSFVESLSQFFSRSPKFYRLKQLLEEKEIPIEEIFAGRPINLQQSHGFIDTREFEKTELIKEIHLSDVYNLLFAVKGVTAIRELSLRNCDGSICSDKDLSSWIFRLWENHVPRFSPKCSGFRFTRNGSNLLFDPSRHNDQVRLTLTSINKRILPGNSPYFDVPIPYGTHLNDLGDYLQLENDFPKVYGIAEGSLPESASDARKAQALQLKGYLLFFDVLLSGYLSQLKSLRSLFSLDGKGKDAAHTYFINRFNASPDFAKLLAFDTEEANTGSSLAYPVNKKKLESLVREGRMDSCNLVQDLPPHDFLCRSERDDAVHQLREDFVSSHYTEYVLEGRNGCWIFYLVATSLDFVLVGKEQYKEKLDAKRAAGSLQFHLAIEKSYRTYTIDKTGRFSFHVAAASTNYWDYLQWITENEQLYLQRRNDFLDHLLARFAETFTDYALLSYSFMDDQQLKRNNIKYKQDFLAVYPDVSSTRGKGYDYQQNGWNDYNISGLEKRFAAYLGINGIGNNNLCHFEVIQYEQQSVVNINWNGKTLFASDQSFESVDEAKEIVKVLLESMTEEKNYYLTETGEVDLYQLRIKAAGSIFSTPGKFSEQDAKKLARQMLRLASPTAVKEDIAPSRFRHELMLQQTNGNRWHRRDPIVTRERELKLTSDLLNDLADMDTWIAEKPEEGSRPFQFVSNPDQAHLYFDMNGLQTHTNLVDVRDDREINQYVVRDADKTFLFISEKEFGNESAQEEEQVRLLFLLCDRSNYFKREGDGNEFYIQLKHEGKIIATNKVEQLTSDEAEREMDRLADYFSKKLYLLHYSSIEDMFQYTLWLGWDGAGDFRFRSAREYPTFDEAYNEAVQIVALPPAYRIERGKGGELEIRENGRLVATYNANEKVESLDELKKQAEDLIALKRVLNEISLLEGSPQTDKMVRPDPVSAEGDYAYRLVKKDGFHAWFKLEGDFTDEKKRMKQVKDIHRVFSTNDDRLEICYGGASIIHERKEGRNRTKWYHYQIRRSTDNLVLLESVRGYASEQAAQAAFTKEYANILTLASDENNYGKLISFQEKFIHQTAGCTDEQSLVFIPDETMRRFSYNVDAARKELSSLATSYPVRTIRKSDPLFKQLFPCETLPEPNNKDCSDAHKEKEYYYFIHKDKLGGKGQWISAQLFESPADALNEFKFFLILLQYKGNYHITQRACDNSCEWVLYLREILAVSSRRFPSSVEAWGEDGVQRFIRSSQTNNAFNTYQRKDDCCYTFNVACGNMGLIHPCTYDTAEKRDRAMASLIQLAKKWQVEMQIATQPMWESITDKLEELVIHENRRDKTPCTTHEDIRDIIRMSFEQSAADIPEESVQRYSALNDSEKKAVDFVIYYYPVVKKKLDTPGNPIKYFVEIKLPGFCEHDFDAMGEYPGKQKGKHNSDDCECCCVSWVSECCFDSCKEALDYFYKVMKCLAKSEHYLPVFDCECGPFGIRFFCDCESHKEQFPVAKGRHQQPVGSSEANLRGQTNRREVLPCCNDIVAFNPQCYTHPGMLCHAVERAMQLVNDEGLHLVEHILLRPHCAEKGKDCDCVIDPCNDEKKCAFEWVVPGEDPCEQNECGDPNKYCFVPGNDPYSFIATALLPAWPERFRKKENRELVEQVLYRETPAHIMLRILWVSPQDLCRFESLYRNWTRWLAGKRVCDGGNPPCDLIRFLFGHDNLPWHCFDGKDCKPCEETGVIPDTCGFMAANEKDANHYVNTLNRLYCWQPVCPPPNRYAKAISRKPKTGLSAQQLAELEVERSIDERFAAYREEARIIVNDTNSTVAARVYSFLHESIPTISQYQEMVDIVTQKQEGLKKGEKKSKLPVKFQRQLIRLSTWYFLDRSILNNDIERNLKSIRKIFVSLKEQKMMPDYNTWQEQIIFSANPCANPSLILQLFK